MATKNQNSKLVKHRPSTEKKLITAVGEVIASHGYKALGINRIAATAGVNKNLVYRYFGNVDNLIERYIIESDYWLAGNEDFLAAVDPNITKSEMLELISSLLQKQLVFFFSSKEMQHIILSEISEDSKLLQRISKLREDLAKQYFLFTDKYFKNSEVDFRGISAILVGGIYYLVLQSQKNHALNCGINLRTAKGRETISKSIKQIVEWSFNRSN